MGKSFVELPINDDVDTNTNNNKSRSSRVEIHNIADEDFDVVDEYETPWDKSPAPPSETFTVGSPGSDDTVAIDDQFKAVLARRVSPSPARPPTGRRPSASNSPSSTPRKRSAEPAESSSSIRHKPNHEDQSKIQLVDLNTLKALLEETKAQGEQRFEELRAEFNIRRQEDRDVYDKTVVAMQTSCAGEQQRAADIALGQEQHAQHLAEELQESQTHHAAMTTELRSEVAARADLTRALQQTRQAQDLQEDRSEATLRGERARRDNLVEELREANVALTTQRASFDQVKDSASHTHNKRVHDLRSELDRERNANKHVASRQSSPCPQCPIKDEIIRNLSADRDSLNNKINTQGTIIVDLEARLNIASEELIKECGKAESLKTRLVEHVNALDLLKTQHFAAMQMVESKTSEIDNLRTYISELESKINNLESQAPRTSHDHSLVELTTKLAYSEKQVVDLRDMIQILKDQVVTLVEDKRVLHTQVTGYAEKLFAWDQHDNDNDDENEDQFDEHLDYTSHVSCHDSASCVAFNTNMPHKVLASATRTQTHTTTRGATSAAASSTTDASGKPPKQPTERRSGNGDGGGSGGGGGGGSDRGGGSRG